MSSPIRQSRYSVFQAPVQPSLTLLLGYSFYDYPIIAVTKVSFCLSFVWVCDERTPR
jgi:hypothetical protein